MANDNGESHVSTPAIETRASELETKLAAPATTVTEPVKTDPTAAAPSATTPEPAKKPEVKLPNDPAELRKWNTKVSMELSDVKKRLEDLAAILNKTAKVKVDYKELAKDPAKLEKAIDAERQEQATEYQTKYNSAMNQATAEITERENKLRFHDKDNYPRWAEVHQQILDLAAKADSRINFNQHPTVVLDELYSLAQQMVDSDPAHKKPDVNAPKTYTKEEMDAAVAQAKAEAADAASKGLSKENAGAGVGSMGKGGTKGKPAVDKQALWNMPLNNLKDLVVKATEQQ